MIHVVCDVCREAVNQDNPKGRKGWLQLTIWSGIASVQLDLCSGCTDNFVEKNPEILPDGPPKMTSRAGEAVVEMAAAGAARGAK